MIDRIKLAPCAVEVRAWFKRRTQTHEKPDADTVRRFIMCRFPTFTGEEWEYLFQNHEAIQ